MVSRVRERGGASHPCTCSKKAVTRVLDTRRSRAGTVVRLRRCEKCGREFRTVETKMSRITA